VGLLSNVNVKMKRKEQYISDKPDYRANVTLLHFEIKLVSGSCNQYKFLLSKHKI